MPQQEIDCDVLVVGGGINGAGIARDAAGRGLSVVLCDKDDLASHTSSASTKLIHGGLRYLEHYEFALVRKALIEREVLLRAAPHIMGPMRFVLPHDDGQRPRWLLRAGLFLYDHLARRDLLPGSCGVDLRRHAAGKPLKAEFTHGFIYSDCWVDDARLVVLNAMDAAEKGALVLTRTACESATRQGGRWAATLRTAGGAQRSVQARCLVNATGVRAAQFLHAATGRPGGKTLRLVKGSHIVVRKLFDHPYAYFFQHPDRRLVFVMPYQHDFTLIGTTECDYGGDPDRVGIEPDESAYLCALASRYLRNPITPADVVWSYAGVRPLLEDEAADAASVTRDYRLELDGAGAPLLSIFGGKITTFRRLAEEAVDLIAPALSNRMPGWTSNACLPGGDLYGAPPGNLAVRRFDHYVQGLQRHYHWLDAALVTRYAHAYGTRIHAMLANRTSIAAMGEQIAAGLFAAEVIYLIEHEWAGCANDILWRRSKLGLHLPQDTAQKLDAWMSARMVVTGESGGQLRTR